MDYAKNGKIYHCPVEAALDVIGGKWKPLILWALGDKVLRFNELQKALPGINTKMLTKQLRALEEDGESLRLSRSASSRGIQDYRIRQNHNSHPGSTLRLGGRLSGH